MVGVKNSAATSFYPAADGAGEYKIEDIHDSHIVPINDSTVE